MIGMTFAGRSRVLLVDDAPYIGLLHHGGERLPDHPARLQSSQSQVRSRRRICARSIGCLPLRCGRLSTVATERR